MKYKDFTGIVPQHFTGKEIIAEATVALTNPNEAKIFYSAAKDRLLNVNQWHRVAGGVSATFQLIDADGKEVGRNAEKSDFIKIDIPGPGSSEGDGFDWVCIEEQKEVDNENMQGIGFRVRPCANPFGNSSEIAHFYSEEATSSFIITREDAIITASIVDRNIKPNDDTESLTDKIRHTAIGMTAINSFSKIQWQNLANGLVERKT